MTYVPCASCGASCGSNHQNPAFDPAASSTAAVVPCASAQCVCGSPRCGCAGGQCTYSRSYAEQSSSSGLLVADLLAMHDGGPGARLVFGCETREGGEIYRQRADGLVGLGNSGEGGRRRFLGRRACPGMGWGQAGWPVAWAEGPVRAAPPALADAGIVNQLVAAGVIDDAFSLCFGSVAGDGALVLGDAPPPPGLPPLAFTPLVPNRGHPFYYNVRLSSIAVGGTPLDVQPVRGAPAAGVCRPGRVATQGPAAECCSACKLQAPPAIEVQVPPPVFCAPAVAVRGGVRHGARQRHHLHVPPLARFSRLCGRRGGARSGCRADPRARAGE